MNTTSLRVDHVSKRYGSGDTAVDAVRDVSLTVEPGEIVLIMGPSGSGKTTLLSMLGALMRPSTGTIEVAGSVVTELAESKLADIRLRKIGFIFQDFNLLASLSARDNVAIVAELAGVPASQARTRATALLTEFGLPKRLGFRPEQLSGGEKQRAAIARAVIGKPELLLADEPTGNVDPQMARRLLRLFIELNRLGTSVIIATHDHQLMRQFKAPRLELHDGHVQNV